MMMKSRLESLHFLDDYDDYDDGDECLLSWVLLLTPSHLVFEIATTMWTMWTMLPSVSRTPPLLSLSVS